ncbi:hypothetical protein CUJ87_32485 (plasmid) [Paraburkholderia caledonica]|nr:hypothetical protein CUJ87_32485 [Paraburkholderia caledonica]
MAVSRSLNLAGVVHLDPVDVAAALFEFANRSTLLCRAQGAKCNLQNQIVQASIHSKQSHACPALCELVAAARLGRRPGWGV